MRDSSARCLASLANCTDCLKPYDCGASNLQKIGGGRCIASNASCRHPISPDPSIACHDPNTICCPRPAKLTRFSSECARALSAPTRRARAHLDRQGAPRLGKQSCRRQVPLDPARRAPSARTENRRALHGALRCPAWGYTVAASKRRADLGSATCAVFARRSERRQCLLGRPARPRRRACACGLCADVHVTGSPRSRSDHHKRDAMCHRLVGTCALSGMLSTCRCRYTNGVLRARPEPQEATARPTRFCNAGSPIERVNCLRNVLHESRVLNVHKPIGWQVIDRGRHFFLFERLILKSTVVQIQRLNLSVVGVRKAPRHNKGLQSTGPRKAQSMRGSRRRSPRGEKVVTRRCPRTDGSH